MRFKLISRKKLPRPSRRNFPRTKKNGSIASQHKDPERLLLFIQAHDYANRPDHFRDDSLKAEELFEQAIKLDPKFAAAFAGLSMVESWMYHTFWDRHRLVEKKRVSMPMNPCACNRIFRKDISRSVFRIIMAIVITSAPSPSLRSRNVTCRTKPKPIWPSAPFSGVRASGRNQLRIWKKPPRSIRKTQASLINLAYSYMALRNFEAADKTIDRAIAVAPQSFAATALKAYWRLHGKVTSAWPKNNFLRFQPRSIRMA